ncbi:hypothetical protein AGMMS50268_16540 [Spirochaetia bacterium]|nr:hypothetical protein AGMMS50268_16540 [Spirochaetia bacterium]
MKLIKYRVTKFRSVQDSGWIDLEMVNALLGENESGKTNLLLPLWKLNPASGGEIDLLSDVPRSEYSELRTLPDDKKPIFITAIFECNDYEMTEIAKLAFCDKTWIKTIQYQRRYDGQYFISFLDAKPENYCESKIIIDLISGCINKLDGIKAKKTDKKIKKNLIKKMNEIKNHPALKEAGIDNKKIDGIINTIKQFDLTEASETGGFIEIYEKCLAEIEKIKTDISKVHPNYYQEAVKKAQSLLPTFIYYSNYGNLDSEIYLPHVIQNLSREKLGEKEASKARTLKVLFEFVKLSPKEILELGVDFQSNERPTEEQIQERANKKKERGILLESASTSFTRTFANWWRQGSYNFRFAVDGDHFRIWVSDSIRSEPIELENRSSGLQWFFSFFLVLLNEKYDEHYGSILLLDEPGINLHPMAQKDLFVFFEGLSKDNQLIYTTHSPFLIDPDKLDQAKAVYIGQDGYSYVSSDLRVHESLTIDSEQKAIYPVHSAIGLTFSEVLLFGCNIMLVEGPSDQFYLNIIKNILIHKGLINPKRELLFIPAAGAKGIKTTARILSHGEDSYPNVLLDSDRQGRQIFQNLCDDLYSGREHKVHQINSFVKIDDAEVEDFCDPGLLAETISRLYRTATDFSDEFDNKRPIVPQIESFCGKNGIYLTPGWKIDFAKSVSRKMQTEKYIEGVKRELLEQWKALFSAWFETMK